MDLFALSEPERALLRELRARGVRFAVIGMGAAVLQGATTLTQDLDLWFERLSPPTIGGALGDRFDIVTHAHGLGSFDEEWPGTIDAEIDGEPVKLLRLERILVSKRAANRPKDVAQIPVLEAAIAARDAGA